MGQPKRRVCVVVNKWWEADPVMAVLANSDVRPASLGWPTFLNYPHMNTVPSAKPRVVLDQMKSIHVDVWCISDLLARYPQQPAYQSSSERKMELLPLIFADRDYDLVIAAGTAAHFPPEDNRNGSVYVGTKLFLHNDHPGGSNPDSNWTFDRFDEKLSSTVDPGLFSSVTDFGDALDVYLLPEKVNSGLPLTVESNYHMVNINGINVTDYTEYEEKDNESLAAYADRYDDRHNDVLETTLGLVSVAAGLETPFFYVAGIVDRVGCFGKDVPHPPYAQNHVGSHNIGVVVVNILGRLERFYGT